MLISHLVNKNIINNLQINNELKLSVINSCIDGIIDILKKNKSNDEIIKIVFIKIINGIISSINTIENISLIQKIFKLDINKNIKAEINNFCKEKNIIKQIFDEFLNFLKNMKEEKEKEKDNKIEIEKRFDLIFLLLENEIKISEEEFKNLFNELTKLSQFVKKIFYTKMKENFIKINTKLSEYIIKDILNKDINDWNNYQLLKKIILQINKSKYIFKYITEKDMIVISKDYNKEIFGYKSL